MKLKGVAVTYPVCDWRPLSQPDQRLSWLSLPYLPKLGHDYVRGFGVAKKRRTVFIPWRPTDAYYFDCSGTIQSLPIRLPGGAAATAFLRRLYLDGRALLRLEVGVFTHPNRKFQRSDVALDDVARWLWNFKVSLTLAKRSRRVGLPSRQAKQIVPLGDALPLVIRNFIERTVATDISAKSAYELLEPHIQVVAETRITKAVRDRAVPIDHTEQLWIRIQRISANRAEPIEAIFLLHTPGYADNEKNFARLRVVRAYVAALHADLQLMGCLLRGCASGRIDPKAVEEHLEDLNRCLEAVNESQTEDQKLVANLLDVLERALHTNVISLLLRGVEVSGVSADIKERITRNLRPHARTSGAAITNRPRSQQERGRSFQSRIEEAITIYADFLLGTDRQAQRYDDSKFRASAIRKAEGVIDRLPPRLRRGRYIIVSVGGADGTELFHLLERTGSTHGILLEYSDASVRQAEAEARRRGVSIATFTGDAMDKLAQAMACACEWRARHGGEAIIVTAQAILHELPTRSKGFTLNRYFGLLAEADVVIGREPIRPHDWPETVVLSGEFDADTMVKLVNLIRQYNEAFANRRFEAIKINRHSVMIDSALAIETLTKAFYSEDFLYELGERITSYSAEELLRNLSMTFKPTHRCWKEVTTSPSFEHFWDNSGVEASKPEGEAPCLLPSTHAWYRAVRKTLAHTG